MDRITRNAARLGMTPAEALEGGFLDLWGNVLPAHPTISEGTTTMIVPVTSNLAEAMNRTSLVLGTVSRNTKKMNDRDAFPELANQLEDLTVNVLQASSSLSLIGVRPAGARFDFAPDTKLSAKVNGCVSYLRNEATSLLKANSFSRYENTHSDAVLDRIKALYGLLTDAVSSQVRSDLRHIQTMSPSRLIAVAASVAEAATLDGRAEATKVPRHLR
ncbi:hypothetical protein SEA_YDN12_48 [Streptomyces phage YDN12]|uniref:Uncharacterized protein n=1 Tax=Streptomyces phage YDN12 TaxID=1636183 RepID=A0A0E3JQF2_9CAUD|nr:hypothetical protein AVT63_gp47 [Streptomyces phage YDN12]AKA61715.1 hypothetical protein SEA_YDN12_48 [Streptomyces phage YDN12]